MVLENLDLEMSILIFISLIFLILILGVIFFILWKRFMFRERKGKTKTS